MEVEAELVWTRSEGNQIKATSRWNSILLMCNWRRSEIDTGLKLNRSELEVRPIPPSLPPSLHPKLKFVFKTIGITIEQDQKSSCRNSIRLYLPLCFPVGAVDIKYYLLRIRNIGVHNMLGWLQACCGDMCRQWVPTTDTDHGYHQRVPIKETVDQWLNNN